MTLLKLQVYPTDLASLFFFLTHLGLKWDLPKKSWTYNPNGRERNARVFEDKKRNIINVKLKSIALLSFWFYKAPNCVLEPEVIVEVF